MSRRAPVGAFWPTPSQEALLRLVLGHDDQIERRWRALQPLDLDSLDPGSFCLLPLLHTRLSEAQVDGALVDRIAGTYRSTWYRNQLGFRCLASAIAALEEHGVAPIVFGGASLAGRFYTQPGHRPVPQLDVLVRPARSTEARDVLLRTGEWRLQQDRADYVRLENQDHIVLVLHRGLPAFLAGAAGPDTGLARLRPRSQSADIDTVSATVLSPADEVVVACGLGARTKTPPSIQWLLDTAAVLASGACQPSELPPAAAALKLTLAVGSSLDYLDRVQERGDLESFRASFRALPKPGRHERAAYRLGGVEGPLGGGAQRLASFARVTADASLAETLTVASSAARGAWKRRRRPAVPSVRTKTGS